MAEKQNSNDEVVLNSGRGATLLMLSQALSKLLTFVLNQLLVRLVSPSLFGIASYLDFLYSTILFFSREAVRLSIQRTAPSKNVHETYQSIINFGFVSLAIGIPISVGILGWQFGFSTSNEVNSIANYFPYTVFIYWVLILLELIVEPIYALNQYKLEFGKRSKFEGIAVFFKCITTVVTIYLSPRANDYNSNGTILIGFSLGQLAYSFTLFASYLKDFTRVTGVTYLPLKLTQNRYFDPNVLNFWRISFVQMIFKQILTEGDKFLVNTFFSVEERGVFSVLNNYGSIIVRLLFNPIEESLRLSFTRHLQSSASGSLTQAQRTMRILLIFYLQFSILLIVAGYFNSSFLLKILLGGKSSAWTSTDLFDLMPWYVMYLPFLAFNGVLEAFFSAAADSQNTKKYSFFMSSLTVAVLAAMYVFVEHLKMGTSGLILVNSLNMLVRVIYCSNFIIKYFSARSINVDIVSLISFFSKSGLAGAAAFSINHYFIGQSTCFFDVCKSAAICLGLLLTLLLMIRDDIKQFVNSVLKPKQE